MPVIIPKPMPSTMRPRQDYGIKIAKKGYDARTASDVNLLYCSSFPCLQWITTIDKNSPWEVLKDGAEQEWNAVNGEMQTVYRYRARLLHNLGYPPMLITTDRPASFADYYRGFWWDKSWIYQEIETHDANYYRECKDAIAKDRALLVAVDISYDVEYPYFDTPDTTNWGETYDYGLKHILSDNPNETDPERLGLNATVQSQLVLAVKVASFDKEDVSFYPLPGGMDYSQLAAYSFVQDSRSLWHNSGVSYQDVGGYRAYTLDGVKGFNIDGHFVYPKSSLVVVRQPMVASEVTRLVVNP